MESGSNIEREPYLLFSSGDPEEQEELKAVLEANPNANVTIVREAHLLKGRMPMPFLDTPEGDRITGISAIQSRLEETGQHEEIPETGEK